MQKENLQEYCYGGKCVVLRLQSIFHKTMTEKTIKIHCKPIIIYVRYICDAIDLIYNH